MDLAALIAKLESASEGSRELDAEIVVALDLRPDWLLKSDGALWVYRAGKRVAVLFADKGIGQGPGNPSIGDDYLPYTTSLDAALTLVPEGWRVTHGYFSTASDRATFCLTLKTGTHAEARAAGTPALALCIASLKARQASSPDPQS